MQINKSIDDEFDRYFLDILFDLTREIHKKQNEKTE